MSSPLQEAAALHRAEQRSRELSEQLHAAVEVGGLGTWRWNLTTGQMVWDERLEALFGLPSGGFDGSFEMFVSLLHPDDRDLVVATVDDAVAGASTYRVEHRVIWPDGSVHWHARVGGVTLAEQGDVTGTVGCVMDITDRVLQHEAQQRVAAEAAERERLHRERLEFLGAINAALSASTTRQQVMTNVTRTAVPRLGDWCTIHVLPFTTGTVPDVEVAHVDSEMVRHAAELRTRFPYDPDDRFGVARVIRTGEAEFHPDITPAELDELHAGDDVRKAIAALDLRSTIAVPLRKRGRVLGALQFAMTSTSRRYTTDDLALAQSVADRIASSIENLRLYQQQRDIARTLQRSLLPATLPTIPGVDLAARYWPVGEGNEVGGDFYDVFALEQPGRWAIVIGDVCGTGPEAAALIGVARHSIRESAWHGDTPTDVLRALNRAVKNSGSGSFLTAIYATLDTTDVRPALTVTSGGHPFPIRIERDATTAHTIGRPGTLLGMLDTVAFVTETRHLNVGDVGRVPHRRGNRPSSTQQPRRRRLLRTGSTGRRARRNSRGDRRRDPRRARGAAHLPTTRRRHRPPRADRACTSRRPRTRYVLMRRGRNGPTDPANVRSPGQRSKVAFSSTVPNVDTYTARRSARAL